MKRERMIFKKRDHVWKREFLMSFVEFHEGSLVFSYIKIKIVWPFLLSNLRIYIDPSCNFLKLDKF
jgi:hypothetical protein